MAAVEVTISGMLYDKVNRTTQNVVLVGEASLTGVGVGGGPMPPGQGSPPGIWGGGNVPMPSPPIANVPGAPGYSPGVPTHPIYYPPGIWGGGNEPFPTPPIVIPPQEPGQPPLVIWGPNDPRPTPPIELPGGGNPPTGGPPQKLIEWKTAWTPDTGWIVVGIPQVPVPTPSKK